jgi:hypothetical protein
MEALMQSPLTEYTPELEVFESENFEWTGETGIGVLGETEEMEFASELLEITNEAELDLFLGKLIRRVGRAAGKFIRSPAFNAIGGVLKGAAKTLLPLAGTALGTFVGGPLGATIGGRLASMAGGALGLELEGLSQEDREFEAARQFVRFASEAVNNAAASPASEPVAAARAATAAAAKKFAPGLLGNQRGMPRLPQHRGHDGRWFRRGRNIVIINC